MAARDEDGSEPFDRAYFDLWYRREGFGSPARLHRKVAYALGAAEYLLDRPVRSVLDVGCGEGAWCGAVRRLRPGATYLGVDPSRYAIARYGKRRNLRLGDLGGLADAVPASDGPFDLVVSVDVLGYADDRDVRAGLAAIAERTAGVALLEVFAQGDQIVGDTDGYRLRRAGTYERWFADAGLHRVGPHLYVTEALRPTLARLELPLR